MHVPLRSGCFAPLLLALAFFPAQTARTQDAAPAATPTMPPSAAIVIPDQPKGIDPATLLPANLAAPVKVEFNEAALADVVNWLQTEQKLGVVLDQAPLAKEGILASDPISDKLDGLPLHLLLDRLQSAGVGWYFEDGLVHLTTLEDASGKLRTTPYNVGDLLDAGYKTDALLDTVTSTVSPTSWDAVGGPGSVVVLGDVLFVSHSPQMHLQVAGLLAALRKHGRRTYSYDAPSHDKLRAALECPVSLDLRDVALSAALAQLAKQAGVDIRLDHQYLRKVGIRERQPVSLTLTEQKLNVVLRILLGKLDLTSVIHDGALWITSTGDGNKYLKTAVYDVRDLCRDEKEAQALQEAVENQIGLVWDSVGGAGSMSFPVPGTMVVYQTEPIHNRLLELLESYRAALRISKPRPRPGSDPKELITRYYRMPTAMASDLSTLLPLLISPETWQTAQREAPGTILMLASRSAAIPQKGAEANSVLIPYSVLVIKQRREVHDQLPEILRRVEEGEAPVALGGGGGFGGGFFSVPSK